MVFKRASVRYSSTPEAVTPYQAAQQLWDERIGSARVQARNWQLMAFGCLVLAIAVTGGLLFESARSKITPYIVEVDGQGGVRSVGRVIEDYHPADAHVGRQLERFIKNVRSVPLDPVVLRDNWLEAYDYTTQRGAVTLNEYARANDPFKNVGQSSTSVDVVSVVRASPSSFQVRWTERHFTNGSPGTTEHWTAILTILMRPPRDEDRLRKNPLGVYVDGLSWSRELGGN